jgi:uncharacterized protein (TIGR02246 family)
MRLQICATILAIATVATPVEAEPMSASDAAVLATVQAFSDARARFDSVKLGKVLTPDYIEVSPRGEVDRRPAVLAFYTPDKAGPVPPMVYSTDSVRRYGDAAIVVGAIEYTISGPDGAKLKRTVRATYVERRVGGRWLMASTQFTGVPQAPAPTPTGR